MKITLAKIIGIIFLIIYLIVFIMFFKNVSIGGKIAKENYEIDGKLDYDTWLWNVGLFVAIMMSLSYMLEKICGLLFSKKENQNEDTR